MNKKSNKSKLITCCLIFGFLFLCLTLCGCEKKEVGILFNKEPITKHNVMNASRSFEAGKRIYYLFYTSKKINKEFIRVQVFKACDKTHVGGYVIVRTNDYRIMKDNDYYYTNYFVLYEPGRYAMQIFSLDDLAKPMAWDYFYVY